MPLENDFTRVFGAIKELEARVEALELGSTVEEDRIRTYMMAGVDPADLKAKAEIHSTWSNSRPSTTF